MDADDIKTFISGFLKIPNLQPAMGMGLVAGWDSIKQIQLMLALEERYEVGIAPDLFGELSTVQAIVDYLMQADS
ncbi:MAG: acyl carrier protein [Magnetococcales bacterium]|nr:acyl carrier protein [Magnetococcales bacterium]NGZ27873.1 acyl carrier protein [Magnetococcales bacterium]